MATRSLLRFLRGYVSRPRMWSSEDKNIDLLIKILKFLTKNPAALLPAAVPDSGFFLKDKHLSNDFIEYVYNYWRSLERFIVCDSSGREFDQRPYRAFKEMVEPLSHLIRSAYRDIQENLTDLHPRIYRQVIAGGEAGVEGNVLDGLAKMPTVFYDDEANNILAGAVPGRDEFGYFGYVKKMILTLHNIKMMKRGRLPFHGAMIRIILKGNLTPLLSLST